MNIPLSDMVKSIPGAFGIRLEEELPYKVIKKMDDVEIREYSPFTLARIKKSGSYDEASRASFKALADFIFGKNDKSKKTSMTTPVFMDKKGNDWIMSFYIEEENADLNPLNSDIWVQEMPAKIVAAYRYSGNNDLEKMEEAKRELLQVLKESNVEPVSEVWWAQYDQPTAIPILKRNEALVKVDL